MSTNRRRSSLSFGETMLFLAGILLCLVMITTAMMGGLYARYTTTDTGSDSARVAKFGDLTLTETGDFVKNGDKYTGIIIPGVDLEKNVKLDFAGSEMATIVFVEVKAPDWTAPDNKTFMRGTQLDWSMADGWKHLDGTQYVYYQELAPNVPLKADIIKDGIIHVSTDIKENNIQLLNDLNLTFRAGVIQNDGSLTPETAWNRLK